jgi:hypothetical protein
MLTAELQTGPNDALSKPNINSDILFKVVSFNINQVNSGIIYMGSQITKGDYLLHYNLFNISLKA